MIMIGQKHDARVRLKDLMKIAVKPLFSRRIQSRIPLGMPVEPPNAKIANRQDPDPEI